MIDLDKIRALLARINAPKGWTYMGEEGAFPLEIRECDSFREVVTLKADPNDLAEAIAELPTALADTVAEVARLTSELAAAQAARDALRERAEHAEAILTGILPGPVSDALVDARNHQSRTEGVSAAADWGRTVGRVQVLAAAQAAPVVVWRRIRDFDEAQMGDLILTVHSDGWTIRAVDIAVDELATLADGDEGGPVGKAACEAAYRRACGLPAIPACAG